MINTAPVSKTVNDNPLASTPVRKAGAAATVENSSATASVPAVPTGRDEQRAASAVPGSNSQLASQASANAQAAAQTPANNVVASRDDASQVAVDDAAGNAVGTFQDVLQQAGAAVPAGQNAVVKQQDKTAGEDVTTPVANGIDPSQLTPAMMQPMMPVQYPVMTGSVTGNTPGVAKPDTLAALAAAGTGSSPAHGAAMQDAMALSSGNTATPALLLDNNAGVQALVSRPVVEGASTRDQAAVGSNSVAMIDGTAALQAAVAPGSQAVNSRQTAEWAPVPLNPANTAHWGTQLQQALGDRLSMQADHGVQHALIRLDPPSLGSLEIAIRHEAGSLQVTLTASNSEVTRQLQAISDNLRHELLNRQYAGVSVQVGQQRGDAQQGQQGGGDQRFARNEPGRALDVDGSDADQHTPFLMQV